MIKNGKEYYKVHGPCGQCCFPRLGISCAQTCSACLEGTCWEKVSEKREVCYWDEVPEMIEGVEYKFKREGDMVIVWT